MINKINLIKELITEYINPGLKMHDGSVRIHSHNLDNNPPTLELKFEGMCGDCPSSFKQTLDSVANFLIEETEIENLQVLNASEKPENFNMKYAFDLEEDE